MEGFAKSFGVTSGVMMAIVIVGVGAVVLCILATCFACLGPAWILDVSLTPTP